MDCGSTRRVLESIFEADLPPEQYAYRPGRNAQQAVVEVEEQTPDTVALHCSIELKPQFLMKSSSTLQCSPARTAAGANSAPSTIAARPMSQRE